MNRSEPKLISFFGFLFRFSPLKCIAVCSDLQRGGVALCGLPHHHWEWCTSRTFPKSKTSIVHSFIHIGQYTNHAKCLQDDFVPQLYKKLEKFI